MSLGPGRRCVSTTGGTATSDRTFWSFRERVEVGNWKRYKIGDSVVVARRFRSLNSVIYCYSILHYFLFLVAFYSRHKGEQKHKCPLLPTCPTGALFESFFFPHKRLY